MAMNIRISDTLHHALKKASHDAKPSELEDGPAYGELMEAAWNYAKACGYVPGQPISEPGHKSSASGAADGGIPPASKIEKHQAVLYSLEQMGVGSVITPAVQQALRGLVAALASALEAQRDGNAGTDARVEQPGPDYARAIADADAVADEAIDALGLGDGTRGEAEKKPRRRRNGGAGAA